MDPHGLYYCLLNYWLLMARGGVVLTKEGAQEAPADYSKPIVTQMVLTKIKRPKEETVGKELGGRREEGGWLRWERDKWVGGDSNKDAYMELSKNHLKRGRIKEKRNLSSSHVSRERCVN